MAIETQVVQRRRVILTPDRSDWKAALGAGLTAGMVALAVSSLLGTRFAAWGAWQPIEWMASLSYDTGAMFPYGILPSVLIAGLTYTAVLSILYTGLIAEMVHRRNAAAVLVIGLAFGLAIYWFHFSMLGWTDSARGMVALVSHVTFGLLAASLYRSFAWRGRVRIE